MSRTTYHYRVQWLMMIGARGGWRDHTGSDGNKSYATGWLHALDGVYPHPAYRLIKMEGREFVGVVEEAPARSRMKVS